MRQAPLRAAGLTVGYDGADVLERLDLEIPDERITALVGANGSGKSTLLRALARLIRPRAGTVLLDGRAIGELSSREVARRLGILPQSPVAPDLLTVEDLVARGRYPHQGLFRQWSEHDEAAVEEALLRDRDGRPARPAARRALGRPAPAGLDRDDARPADRGCCCSTSRRRSSTSPIRSTCSTCSTASSPSAAGRS